MLSSEFCASSNFIENLGSGKFDQEIENIMELTKGKVLLNKRKCVILI